MDPVRDGIRNLLRHGIATQSRMESSRRERHMHAPRVMPYALAIPYNARGALITYQACGLDKKKNIRTKFGCFSFLVTHPGMRRCPRKLGQVDEHAACLVFIHCSLAALSISATESATTKKGVLLHSFFVVGDPSGNRTRVSSVRG